MPGVVNVKAEAERQKREREETEAKAATVLQKWTRGMFGRKRARRQRANMKQEIDFEFDTFAHNFKMNDKFNLKKFLGIKQKLRAKNMTDSIEEDSITENIPIADSLSGGEIPIESHLLKSGLTRSTVKPPSVTGFQTQHDPLSIINIYLRKNNLIPEEP